MVFLDWSWLEGKDLATGDPSLDESTELDLVELNDIESDSLPTQGFFPGGVPPSGKNFANPPNRHLSPFLDQGLSPPAEVRPRKFEKFK